MTGIFGCVSFSRDSKQFEEAIITSLDKRRGRKTKIYVDSRAIIGVQYNESPSDVYFLERGDFVIALLSSMITKGTTEKISRVLSNRAIDVLDEYSAVVYDKSHQRLWLSSDVFNIRKVYYLKENEVLFFSSSLRHLISVLLKLASNKIFLSSIDIEPLIFYIASGIFPPGYTLFSNVKKTLPGEKLIFNSSGKILHEEEFLNVSGIHVIFEEKIAEDLVFNTLLNSVCERISDYNKSVAVSLSGGIDSSLILSLLTRVYPREKIVGVHINVNPGENQSAELIADHVGIKLNNIDLPSDPSRLLDLFEEGLRLVEEPTTRSGFVSRFVALKNMASLSKVVFLGEGGDELFLGYSPELWTWDEKVYVRPLIKSHLMAKILTSTFSSLGDFGISKLRVLPACFYEDPILRYALSATILDLNLFSMLSMMFRINVSQLIVRKLEPIIKRAQSLGSDRETLSSRSYLLLFILPYSDVLMDENFASFFNVSLKLPFFDREATKLAFSLSRKLKLNDTTTKYIIRRMCENRKLIPAKILQSKQKLGFIQPEFFLQSEEVSLEIKDKLKILPLNSSVLSLLNQLIELPRANKVSLTLLTYFESLGLY